MDAVVQRGSPTAAFTVQEGTEERGAMEAPGNTECHVCVSSVRPMSPMGSWSEVRRGVQCVQIMHLMVYGLLNITRILQML